MDTALYIFEIAIRLFITMFLYLAIPVIISHFVKNLTKRKALTIVIVNCVACFLIIRWLEYLVTGIIPTDFNMAPAVVWGMFAYQILKKKVDKSDAIKVFEEARADNTTDSYNCVNVERSTYYELDSNNVTTPAILAQKEHIHPFTKLKNRALQFFKKYFGIANKKSFGVAIATLLLLVSTVVFSSMYFTALHELKSYKTSNEVLQEKNSELEKIRTDLNKETRSLNAKLKDVQQQNIDIQGTMNLMVARLDDIIPKYMWYEENVALVNHYAGSGQKYHVIGCQHLGSTFYVFTSQAAQANGWWPCSVCHK